MRPPPQRLLLLLALSIFLVVFIQLNIVTIAFDKLGLSPDSALLLVVVTLIGSMINLPLFSMKVAKPSPGPVPLLWKMFKLPQPEFTGKTIIAVNVGGCVIPVAFSGFLLANHTIGLLQVIIAVSMVSLVSYVLSRPMAGVGIAMPMFVAPVTAALTAVILSPEQSAPLAYICGTLGVLIGADVLHLKDIGKMGPPVAAIGGAGTFDGIFITGIVAVLLA